MKKSLTFYKQRYYALKNTACPALDNEVVYFNNRGFNHLIRKEGVPRTKAERHRRLSLIVQIPNVIANGIPIDSRLLRKDKAVTQFWSLGLSHNKGTLTVILRKVNKGKLHFYSIFDSR